MNMELFSNVDEGTNFLNYKAKNRITNLENLCNQDEKDILDYINSCSNIFQKYNKNNLIEEIYNVDSELQSLNSDDIEENKITELKGKREIASFEFKQFIEELQSLYDNENLDLSKKACYLSDREDIEFAYKKIINRSLDIHDKKNIIGSIEESYPEAREFNVDEFKKTSITFKMINDYMSPSTNDSSFEPTIETNNEKSSAPEFDEDLYVIKISEAPESLTIKDKEETKKIEYNNPISVESDTTFFGEDDALTESILNNDIPQFEEVEEVKTTPLEDIPLDVDLVPVTDNDEKEHSSNKDESKNLKEVSDSSENTISVEENNSEEKAKENSEESEVIPPAEEPQKEDSSNEMTYTMDENDTLSNIALALFEDQTLADKAVNKIIKNNKEAIDKRLAEKNITDDKNIATEKGILTGITLNLSKVFEEVVKNNN
ncbi:MAG: hypothetical protein MR765_06755 [Tenericutes bacterium]|nr:hypothetical protein [Mycoplasmatota bacterium]